MTVIVIDPGHGGQDPGVTHDTLAEKDLTLTLARLLRRHLLETGWPVAVELTRGADEDLSLHARAALGRKYGADLVLALHVNSAPEPQTSGLMTFARAGDLVGESVARVISAQAPAELRRKVNGFFSCDPLGMATDPGQAWLLRSSHVLMQHAPTPAVLVEMGHLTNDGDRAELQRPDVQRGIVTACMLGVDHFMGVTGRRAAVAGGRPLVA